MKKFVAFGVAVVLLSIYVVSSSDDLMKVIASYRYANTSVFAVDKYRYGDLYGMSFLRKYKKTCSYYHQMMKDPPGEVRPVKFSTTQKVSIYAIHDSYLNNLSDSLLFGADRLYHISSMFPDEKIPPLEPGENTILIIETVERAIRYFADTVWVFRRYPLQSAIKDSISTGKCIVKSWLYNPLINTNLAFNIFDNIFFTPIRELRAEINYRFWGRVNKEVTISTDGKYLLFRETVDASRVTSSFAPITDEEVESIVLALNATYKHYKAMGFDQVYFSMIPNPVSIVSSDIHEYNNLITRIQKNKHLLMPTVDMISVFMRADVQIYYTNDSHWNRNGFQLWLNEVNLKLVKNAEQVKQ